MKTGRVVRGMAVAVVSGGLLLGGASGAVAKDCPNKGKTYDCKKAKQDSRELRQDYRMYRELERDERYEAQRAASRGDRQAAEKHERNADEFDKKADDNYAEQKRLEKEMSANHCK